MANSISTNPLVLDTTGSILTTPVIIASIVWTGITTGNTDLLIKDKIGGNIIIQAIGVASTDYILVPALPIRTSGLYLETIDSGKVIIYLK